MRGLIARFTASYGSNPLHLLGTIAALALAGYVVIVLGPQALWNRKVWWQSIAVWFLAAIIAHDLILFPLYAVAGHWLLLGLITALIALLTPIYNVVQFSYRIALIPDALQGRVNSTFRLIAFGLGPVGAGLSGVLVERIGAAATVATFASWYLLLAVLSSLNTHVRAAAPLNRVAAGSGVAR